MPPEMSPLRSPPDSSPQTRLRRVHQNYGFRPLRLRETRESQPAEDQSGKPRAEDKVSLSSPIPEVEAPAFSKALPDTASVPLPPPLQLQLVPASVAYSSASGQSLSPVP